MPTISQPPPPDMSDATVDRLLGLSRSFGELADTMHHVIRERPLEGASSSRWAADLAHPAQGSADLLLIASPGILGLMHSCRGNARALQHLYSSLGPAVGDPAPLDLMRGVWERAALLIWLLDAAADPGERIGRVKGWVEEGHRKERLTTPSEEDFHVEISEWLSGIHVEGIQPPSNVDLARRHDGEHVYRRLSGLMHGRAWSSLGAVASGEILDGFAFAWRGYPLDLHHSLADCTIDLGVQAAQTYSDYVR